VLDRLARAASLVELKGDPFLEVLDAVAADAQFQEIESHTRNLAAGLPAFNDAESFAQAAFLPVDG
jgi:hypothetical protein